MAGKKKKKRCVKSEMRGYLNVIELIICLLFCFQPSPVFPDRKNKRSSRLRSQRYDAKRVLMCGTGIGLLIVYREFWTIRRESETTGNEQDSGFPEDT